MPEAKEDGKGHRERLRERFMRKGLDAFSEHEVIELILTLCIPRSDVKGPAKALLHRFGSLKAILDAPPEEISGVHGIGKVTPVALQILKAAATRYLEEEAEERPLLDSTDALIDLWRLRLGGLKLEVFEVAFLNQQFHLMREGVERLEEGLPNRTKVYPQKVAAAALRRHAVHIAVAHNHPSGQREASEADHRLTTAIKAACQAVGVNLLDHVIVTPDGAVSFLNEGWL